MPFICPSKRCGAFRVQSEDPLKDTTNMALIG